MVRGWLYSGWHLWWYLARWENGLESTVYLTRVRLGNTSSILWNVQNVDTNSSGQGRRGVKHCEQDAYLKQ